MTLLTITQAVARVTPTAAPSMVVGSSDADASLLLACAQDEGEALARRPSLGWTAMIKEYTFTTVAISTTGDTTNGSAVVSNIPSTASLVAGTFYCTGIGIPNNTTILSVDSGTQVTLNQAATATGAAVALTFGQSDYALPSDFQRMVDRTLWDRSRFWELRGPLSPQQWQLYKSSVIGRASIQRRWRIRYISGVQKFSIDPVPGDNGSTLVFEYVSNAWCKSSGGTPQTSWQADDDVGILDEYLLRLGVKWRFLERMGLVYVSARDEYERAVNKAIAADGGAPVLDMSPGDPLHLIGPWQAPETGYGS